MTVDVEAVPDKRAKGRSKRLQLVICGNPAGSPRPPSLGDASHVPPHTEPAGAGTVFPSKRGDVVATTSDPLAGERLFQLPDLIDGAVNPSAA